jgi:hypothetical protein
VIENLSIKLKVLYVQRSTLKRSTFNAQRPTFKLQFKRAGCVMTCLQAQSSRIDVFGRFGDFEPLA